MIDIGKAEAKGEGVKRSQEPIPVLVPDTFSAPNAMDIAQITYVYPGVNNTAFESAFQAQNATHYNPPRWVLGYNAKDSGTFNFFEACFKYTFGGVTKYYAGAQVGGYDSAMDLMVAVCDMTAWRQYDFMNIPHPELDEMEIDW